MIRVLIADDHAIVRDGLRRILGAVDGIEVAAEAADGHEVLMRVRQANFDVLLLDMSMPGRSGIELIRQLRSERPGLPILVLSMHAEDQYAMRAIRAGAAGYLSKDCAQDVLVAALRKTAAGGMYLSGALAEQMAMSLRTGASASLPHQNLTDRELEVFLALVNGETVSAIANRLHLSIKTISTHKAHVHEKTGMGSIAALTQYALTHRLIDHPG